MICPPCKRRHHYLCPAHYKAIKTLCDCQHDTSGSALNPAFKSTSNEASK